MLYIYIYRTGCLFVRLCPINEKTTEPTGPTFFVGPNMTPGTNYKRLSQKNVSNLENPRNKV